MSPITRVESGFGPGSYATPAPNVPTTPVYSTNQQFSITVDNDVMTFTSDQGGPVNIEISDGCYTGATLATELETKMNANSTLTGTGTITFVVDYSTTDLKFTIDATSGHTIALSGFGTTSDAAATFGFRENKSAAQTLTSDYEVYGAGTITFTFTENGNSDVVEYAIYNNTNSQYLGNGTELVTNGDMELDSDWTIYGDGANARSSEQSYNGTYSQKITIGTANDGVYQNITGLTVGRTYKATVWYYGLDLAGDSFYLYFGSADIVAISNGAWVKLTVIFTATATSEILYILIFNTGHINDGKIFYVDNASVQDIWDTFADLDNGGTDGKVTDVGLTNFTTYTYKVKAKGEDGTESAFSSNSASMYTAPAIDYSDRSTVLAREITTGNTKVDITQTIPVAITGEYGAITATFTLKNNSSTASRILAEYSEDGSTWATCTDYFTIASTNDVLAFTSDQGAANIDVADGTYNTGAAMATALQDAMNADNTLTGTGTITFAVSYSSTTHKYTIDAGSGHTIALNYYTSDGAYTYGFNTSHTAAQTITSDEGRGDCPRTLTTSAAGVEHEFVWDSYSDAGTSEYDTTVYLRITPYDTSPSGGDAGQAISSAAFEVDNRPVAPTVINADTFTFDEDTTPIFMATMTNPRGGSVLFFRLKVYDYQGNLTLNKSSALEFTGWEYETSTDTWVAVTVSGISAAYVDGVNRVRYTVQAGDAITQANIEYNGVTGVTVDKSYQVYMEAGELRDRG